MAHFTANAQVFKHSLIYKAVKSAVSVFLLLMCAYSLVAQEIGTDNKKALKYYNKAEDLIKSRDFNAGIANYKLAIEKDPGFAQGFKRLAMAYEILRELDSALKYYDLHRQLVGISQLSEKSALFMIELYLKQGQYHLASELFGQIAVLDTQNDSYQQLKQQLDFIMAGIQHPIDLPFVLLSDSVNRFYNQYFPSITVDNNQLIFTRRNGQSPLDDEDLVISYYQDGAWTEAISISDRINSPYNEGASTISADGRTLIFTSCEENNTLGSCDLFISFKNGDIWSKPRNLGPTVNSIYWDSQPSISADGRTLYFSSNRPGGAGGRDIWFATYENDQWQPPKNVGRLINTVKDEVTPYIHFNNQNLFFSSAGHLGFGGFDLYYSELQDTLFTNPVNLGFGINNHLDQISMAISADGKNGYFAQEYIDPHHQKTSKLAKVDISRAELIKKEAYFVTGIVIDSDTGRPVKSEITLNDLSSDKLTYQTQSDGMSGAFYFVLTQGSTYGVFVKANGYLFEDFTFDVSSTDASRPDTLLIALQPLKRDARLTLENIYFEFDSYELSRKSIAELRDIARFLIVNRIKVEISGHTDTKGSVAYNHELSKKRAQTVYDFLIALKVPADRITHAGYGSTQLLIPHAPENPNNRRIDFKILEVY